VFAHSVEQARRLGWTALRGMADTDWIDTRVRWLRSGCEHLRQGTKPHVIDSPPVCKICELWSTEPLDERGYCTECAYEVDEEDAP
jgi:hypothetical protein